MRIAAVLACFVILSAGPGLAQDAASQPPLDVSPAWEPDHWIRRETPIELGLNRPPAEEEGRLAILIDQTDWTALFVQTPTGLRLEPGAVRLPTGERQLAVHLVAPGGEWSEIARIPLRVLTAGGFERAAASPRLEVGLKGQVFDGQSPPNPSVDRRRYQDVTVTAGLQTETLRNGWRSATSLNVVGVSRQNEALRFGLRGEDAPHVDLASYTVDLANTNARFALGHLSQGTHRHLLNAFASRGASAWLRLGPYADLSLAGLNGSAIAGWNNIFGLDSRDHQVLHATVGIEARPARPGALRVEASLLDGSLLPIAGFAQGVVNDAERSRGGGVRVAASDPSQRLRLDAGYARSRFRNPVDPLLQRFVEVVPVREEDKDARYLDASYAVAQNAKVGQAALATVVLGYHHERVDPLYRSVGAPGARADLIQNAIDATATVGVVNASASHSVSHDNLDAIASILKTLTRTTAVNAAVPLAGLGRDPARPQPALPTVSYGFARTHQYGEGTPENSDFLDPSQIPDQVSDNHTIGVDWQFPHWRAGYRFNRSFQDNRQPGRDRADLANLANNVTFGLTPHPVFDLGADFAFDGAENRETARVDLTRRLGLNANWRPAARTAVTGIVALTWMRDRANTSENRSTDLNLQLSQALTLWPSKPDRLQGQAFIRFSRRSALTLDRIFLFDSTTSAWSVNTGLNLRVF